MQVKEGGSGGKNPPYAVLYTPLRQPPVEK